jgi:hypothetical protein
VAGVGFGGSGQFTIPVPAGTQDKDLLIMVGGYSFLHGIQPPTPSGWTVVGEWTSPASGGSPQSVGMWCWEKIAKSEPPTYTLNAGDASEAVIYNFCNYQGVEVISSDFSVPSFSLAVARSVTTLGPNRLVLVLWQEGENLDVEFLNCQVDVNTFDVLGSMLEGKASNQTKLEVSSFRAVNAGPTGDRTIGDDLNTSAELCGQVAIVPG